MGISLKELKKNRMTPAEKWVLEQIECAEPKTIGVWCNKNGRSLFTKDFQYGFLWVSYVNISSVLANEFGLNHNEIIELLANILYDYTNKGQLKIALL